MKLTFLGHASWLVQSEDTTLVCDLLVENFFRNGTFTICPTRTLDLGRMPRLDALVISHRHRDHFDLETLYRLDRSTKVLCPKDDIILRALDRLGYRNIETFADWTHHTVGALDVVFTPSLNRVPENGMLVTDGETVFWNQVDTVITAETIAAIHERVGQVDLVAHGYQPMLETAALESLGTPFPVAAYAGILHRAKLLAPRAIVPGSNGYRTAGIQSWFNAFKFPLSRERFVRDIAAIVPGAATFIPNAGDVMELSDAGMTTERQAAPNDFVRTPVDDSVAHMSFDPTADKPALFDENPGQIAPDALRRMTRTIFEERVPEGCKKNLGRFHPLRTIGAMIEIRVLFPDGARETWMLDLRNGGTHITLGDQGDVADYVMSIAASSLHDLALGRTRPDVIALSGQFRFFTRAYRVDGGRIVSLQELAPVGIHRQRAMFPWLLFALVGYEKDFEARQVEAEVDRLLGSDADVPLWDRLAPSARPAPIDAQKPRPARVTSATLALS